MACGIMFDTLHYANKLKAAGIPAKQAEIQAETLAEVFEESEKQLVTKTHLDSRVAELRFDLIKWLLGTALGQATIIVSLLKFFH